MTNLYELTKEYTALIADYEAAETDAERAEIFERLDAVQDSIGDKAEAYARIMRNMKASAEAYKAEAQRLARKQKAAEAAVEGLKQRLIGAMQMTGANEIRTSIGKWRLQLNPVSCKVIDADRVPRAYHIPQPDKIDSKALIDVYKATGEIIDGVEFVQETGIRFR